MSKALYISELLEKRIRMGDYAVNDVPAERELAMQMNVARETARKAIKVLEDKGLLTRMANGRITPQVMQSPICSQIALAVPAYYSLEIFRRQEILTELTRKMNLMLRLVCYVHWDDPILLDCLDRFDGIFLQAPAEEKPSEHVLKALRQVAHKLVLFEWDMRDEGIPSLCVSPSVSVSLLMEHLHSLGHTRIDCVNTQPMDCVIQQRIEQWQRWCERHKITGRLWNRPVASYQSALPQAYHLMCDVLDDSSFNATAVVCMTMEVARATTAVIQKRGLVVGQDISVCTIGGEDEAAYCYPSITNTEPSDATQIIQACLDWMINDAHVGKPVQINKSREMILVPRDSTGPCPLK